MTTEKPELLWSDAWLLAAIYGASLSGKITLARVIGMGDYINHAIFTHAEVNGGLSRLRAHDLIAFDEGTYKLTPRGREVTNLCPKATSSAFEQMELIRKRIHAPDWEPGTDPNAAHSSTDNTEYVTKEQLDRAYKEYCTGSRRNHR